jgi:hypothetical protein
MTDEDLIAEKDGRIAQLSAEIARSKVSRESGVPIGLLGDATTEDDARAAAAAALAWRGEPAPSPSRPGTSAVPASTVSSPDNFAAGVPPQIRTHSELQQLEPSQVMDAYRGGRLQHMTGVDPARPIRIGVNGSPVQGK